MNNVDAFEGHALYIIETAGLPTDHGHNFP